VSQDKFCITVLKLQNKIIKLPPRRYLLIGSVETLPDDKLEQIQILLNQTQSISITRTDGKIDKPLPTRTTYTKQKPIDNFPDKYIEQKDMTGNVPQNIRHSSILSSSSHIPRTDKRNRIRRDVDTRHSDSTDSAPRNNKSKTNSSNTQTSTSNINMDHDTSLVSHSSSNTFSNYYTFIIHKSNLPTIPTPTKTRTPTFAAFDHGDHYHCLYTVSHNKNAINLNNILQFLKASYPGTAEVHTTIQRIRHRKILGISLM
jgi:hypothetical protein